MALTVLAFATVLAGLFLTAVLFFRIPRLPELRADAKPYPLISVIIPARNEEMNLPLLLEDLKAQSLQPFEVICADDASEDATARIAADAGARLVSLKEKPDGWTGKSWACQNGADAASGSWLLFLDADVRLGRDGIRRLAQAAADPGCIVSVHPYHRTVRVYEPFSLLFNLVQIAANGTALPKPLDIGLFGPVILIPKAEYDAIGGHRSVRSSVTEDIALGGLLRKSGLPFMVFTGDSELSFRMYGGGLRSLLQGWSKNMAAGAAKTPLLLFAAVFLWITSLTSVPLQLILTASPVRMPWLVFYGILYAAWVLVLTRLARRIGNFPLWVTICYPAALLVFLGVFAVSGFRRLFRLKSTWKGRAVAAEEKQCH